MEKGNYHFRGGARLGEVLTFGSGIIYAQSCVKVMLARVQGPVHGAFECWNR